MSRFAWPREDVVIACVILAAVAAVVIVMLALNGCGLPPGAPLDAAAYEAEQMACIADAGTADEANQCRCAVQARYGRDCSAYVPLRLYDGGTR